MKHTVLAAQNVSRMCLVCGVENPSGLQGRFFELDNDELLGVFRPREGHQGYPGRLHGGISSAMLDETIGRAVNIANSDEWGVTVELSVKYRKPVPVGEEVRVLARLTRDSSRLFQGAGEILLAAGTVAVEAVGKYLKMPIARIAEGDFHREWFRDERPRPDTVEV